MFTKIYLKNFTSFGEVQFNLMGKNNIPKNIALVYGENGSGKSNLISSLLFLKRTMETLHFFDIKDELISDESIDKDKLIEIIKKQISLVDLINEYKMISSIGEMIVKYEFYINDKYGYYEMVFDNNQIIEEKLYYVLNKNSTFIFKISKNEQFINQNLFLTNEYKNEIKNELNKYFGRHTFLSIMFNQYLKLNHSFLKENLNENFDILMRKLMTYSVLCKRGSYGLQGMGIYSNRMLKQLGRGKIELRKEEELNIFESALDDFFTSLFSDIKRVFYKKDYNEYEINYELYFSKLIYGKIIDIPYKLESRGTLRLLELFPLIYELMNQGTVFIDEIDSGIHDLLFKELIMYIYGSLKGQLVATTHNTTILEEINPTNVFVIRIDGRGNKQIVCIENYMDRIQENHNNRKRYLAGIYDGVPIVGYLDLESIYTNTRFKLDELKMDGDNHEQEAEELC